jgi:hypothetical protein
MTKIFTPLCLAVGLATAGTIVAPVPAVAQDCAQLGVGSSAFKRCMQGKAAAVRGAAERKAMEIRAAQEMQKRKAMMEAMEAQKRQAMEAQKQQQVEAQKKQTMEAQKQKADDDAQRRLNNPGKSDEQ